MTSPRKKQHHTLSDLLADDVRDYFLREGVPAEPPQHSRSEGGRRNARKSLRSGRPEPPSSNSENRATNRSPQKMLKSLPPSEMATFPTLRMENFDQDDVILVKRLSTSSERSNGGAQTQQRGQNTAERPNHNRSHDRSSSNGTRQMQEHAGQEHRRHGSGSGSFNSRGSNSSRLKRVSAADAEFLRRYAEERERTNMRMQASPEHPPTGNSILSPPKPVSKNYHTRPYHGSSISPRPPTVAGSHRPGLPSIDNDDWEEDDRIEKKDRLKKTRREARVLDRHRRKQSSIDGSIGGSSFVRQNTAESVNDTMDYSFSTSSASNFMSSSSPNQDGYSKSSESESNKQTRHVRPLSYLSASSESGGEAGETSQQESRGNDAYFNRPSPPASYMSGNDSYSNYRPPSGNDSYYSRQTTLATPDFMFTPSPVASYNMGGPKFMGCDASTMHSSLRGSSIYSAASSRERCYETGYSTNESSNTGGYKRSPQEDGEESSERSYDSYDSDESSYSSDSYYESHSESNVSSSSSSSNHWERVANARHDYRGAESGHRYYRDTESGRRDERQMLLNKNKSNYSSVSSQHQTKPTRKKNRDQKHRRKHRQEELRGPPLRLDDAIGLVWKKMYSLIVMLELLISNMPSLIGSLALAWASLGVDWFKWYEENADDCIPTDYHDKDCVYPEFPGCFACDTTTTGYRVMLNFHYLCSTFSFVLASCLIGKILIAFPVVRDELANPTTAAPLGLLCMALDKVFAGNFGYVGAAITFMSSALQTTVAIW